MIRHDLDDISDFEFDSVVLPCDEKLEKYVKDYILNDYVANYIAVYYKGNAMWDEPFETQVKTALEDLSHYKNTDCNYSKIKEILEKKFKLKVVCDSPIDIKELKKN